jgi:hypothetical protein
MEDATRLAKRGQRRRWGAIGLATMLALAATATVLVAVAQQSSSGWFLRIRKNLSAAEELWSVYPDITTDADGDPITVVWIEEYDEWPTSGYLGHVYLRAATAASGGWGNKVTVFAGSNAACAYYKPAVAVTGTVAHIAYVVNKPCGSGKQYTELHYNTCQVTGETWMCGTTEVVTATRIVSALITTVDVAVNDAGDPRIVWTQYYELPPDSNQWYGTIYYQAKENGVWGDTETVWDSGNSGNPAIAWANGYDHVVCEYQDDPGGVGVMERILYRRRGSGGWASPRVLFDYHIDITLPGYYPPGNPDVAARGGHVYAVWDVSYDDALSGSPETYVIVYRYSDDDGGNFYPLWQVHPDNNPGHGNLAYYDPVESDQLGRLQPSIALGEDYLPGVVWHGASAETGDLPSIYFSLVLSDTGKWLTPTVLISDWNDLGVGAAEIWMAKEDDGTPFGHVAYMRKWDDYNWDVFYESGSEVIPEYPTIYLPLITKLP